MWSMDWCLCVFPDTFLCGDKQYPKAEYTKTGLTRLFFAFYLFIYFNDSFYPRGLL